MPWSMIEDIFDQLVGFRGTLRPYSMNEPFMDKRMMDIVKLAKERVPKARIVFNTNGDLLTLDMLQELLDMGVKVRVSAYDKKTVEKFSEQGVTVTDLVLPKEKIREMYHNRSGNVEAMNEQPIEGMCSMPFIQMIVRYNGDVVLCCNDYRSDVVMGSVKDDRLLDIWNNEKFAEYRHELGMCRRSCLELCSECSFAGI